MVIPLWLSTIRPEGKEEMKSRMFLGKLKRTVPTTGESKRPLVHCIPKWSGIEDISNRMAESLENDWESFKGVERSMLTG